MCLVSERLEHLTLPWGLPADHLKWVTVLLSLLDTRHSESFRHFKQLSSISVELNHHSDVSGETAGSIWAAVCAALKLQSLKKLDMYSGTPGTFPTLETDKGSKSSIEDLTLRGKFHPIARSFLLGRCSKLVSLTVACDAIPQFPLILGALDHNKSTLKHFSVHTSRYKAVQFSGLAPTLIEIKSLKSLEIDGWMMDRNDPEVLSFNSLPPNLESLTIRTELHPRNFFGLLDSLLSEDLGPQSLTSLHVTYRLERRDCGAFLCEKLLREHLDSSFDTISLTSAFIPCGLKTHAIATVNVNQFSNLAVDLRKGQGLKAVSKNLAIDDLTVIRPRLSLNKSTAAKDITDLWKRLEHFHTVWVEERPSEKAARRRPLAICREEEDGS